MAHNVEEDHHRTQSDGSEDDHSVEKEDFSRIKKMKKSLTDEKICV